MKSVIFVETKNEGIMFKCDTFWSKSENPRHAKVYSNSSTKELKGWLQSVLPSHVYTDMIEKTKDKYDKANLGYFTPDENLFENQYYLKKDVSIKDLGKAKYLYTIQMNDTSKWIIKKEHKSKKEGERDSVNLDTKSIGYFIDYKQCHRDDIINEVLKEKESE
jgi:hypothetical protein